MEDDGCERCLGVLILLLHVLELHVLQFLDHSLVVGFRLLEDLTSNGFLCRCEDLVQEELVALCEPPDGGSDDEYEHDDLQNGFHR